METRAITFRKLKENCRLAYVYESHTLGELCCHDMHSTKIIPCESKNCPVWRKLKKEG
jgi:hypothetical protein